MSTPGLRASPTRRARAPRSARSSTRRARRPARQRLRRPSLDAYATLFAESGLDARGSAAAPGADQEGFDPAAIIAASGGGAAKPSTQLLGIGDTVSGLFLSPLRQLSFWKMKDRARAFGENGAHELLARLQIAAPRARFHLMGHSFGCIVASATVAGPAGEPDLPRPVDSLFLVQGALSLWSYASDIPYAAGTAGYFNRIVKHGLVRGPIVTTRSSHDTAVGRFYPLGAQVRKQLVLGDELPAYGGIGSFGIQGAKGAEDMPMGAANFAYGFKPGAIYNLEASEIIKNGGGASGAHSDIAHPEVAHAFWSAALAAPLPPTATLSPGRAGEAAAPPRGGLLGRRRARSGARRERGDRSSNALQFQVQTQEAESCRCARSAYRDRPPVGSRSAPGPPEPAAAPGAAMGQRRARGPGRATPSSRPAPGTRWRSTSTSAQHADALTAAPFADASLFPQGVDETAVTVQLDSADFDIPDPIRPLRVPRSGKSRNKARFEISPRHEGASSLTATLHKDGNFLQSIAITFVDRRHGPGARARRPRAAGRPRPRARFEPRDVGLQHVARATAATTASPSAPSPRARTCRCSRRSSPARSRRRGAS